MLKTTIAVALLSASLCGCTIAPTNRTEYKSPTGLLVQEAQPFPSFSLPLATGGMMTSTSLNGKPTLISFFTEACGPCLHEIPALNAFRSSRKDLNVVAISPDAIDDVRTYPEKYKIQLPISGDGDTFLFEVIGIKAFPTFAVLDENGNLLGMTYGNQLGEDKYASVDGLNRWVDQLIREH